MTWRTIRVILVATALGWASVGEALAQLAPDRVLVMPFENETREGRAFWLAEASAVLLGDELSALGAAAIHRQERREAFERLQVPPAAVLTDATVMRIGQLVGAAEVVVGTFRLEGNSLVVRARSLVLDTGRVRRRVVERGSLLELFALFERVAHGLGVAAARRVSVAPVKRPDVGAFESYVKGLVADVPSTAMSYLKAALAAQPSFDRARLALWDVYSDQGDHTQAADEVAQVAADSPLRSRARFLLGLSQLRLELNDDAFLTFASLAEERRTPAVLNNLGVAQLRRSGTEPNGSAAYYFNQAASADPSEPDFFFNLGYAYWTAKDVTAASYWLREAVRRNPADGEAHFLLGTALSILGQSVEAAREKELAKRLSSVFDQWDKSSGAEAIPKGLERLKGDLALPHSSRVDAALTDQRNQRELAAFYLERGRRLYEQDNAREALAELKRALFLDPYRAEAHVLTGRIHLRGGRPAEAVDALKIALWSEETAVAHAVLAEAHLQMKDFEAAQVEAKKALALNPSLAEAVGVLERAERRER